MRCCGWRGRAWRVLIAKGLQAKRDSSARAVVSKPVAARANASSAFYRSAEPVCANTTRRSAGARSAEAAAVASVGGSASTGDGAVSARSVEEAAFASMDEDAVGARTAEEVKIVSMGGYAVRAKSAEQAASVTTGGSAVAARIVGSFWTRDHQTAHLLCLQQQNYWLTRNHSMPPQMQSRSQ